jgi:N utilization substance protein A
MNINLASRVTGYSIDAYGVNQYKRLQDDQNTLLADIEGIKASLSKVLNDSNIKTVMDLMDADEESLSEIKGLSSEEVETVFSLVQSFIEREIDEPEDENNVDLSVSEEE